MIEKAIARMAEECADNTAKAYYAALVYIEEHYTKAMNERIAEKILQQGKTLTGAYRKLEGFARAGHLTCVTDDEGFAVVDEYYGITPEDYSGAGAVKSRGTDADDFDILDLL